MRIVRIFCLCLWTLTAHSQRVEMVVADNVSPLTRQRTQTEVRPGWKISDFQLKSRCTRYFWGSRSTQLADSNRPTLVITPGEEETLVQYALIQLKRKKDCRKLPKPMPTHNAYTRVTPRDFLIRATGDESFTCQPLESLEPGDYLLLNIEQAPVGDQGDYEGYTFRVEETR
ncbi:MAG: hypothetical protein HUK03_04595 [Bacteroidaceae bacterium]|nr:hypothetical protein [Bacteroidaceae bacterium]